MTPLTSTPANRTVRIFVSSTFQDMGPERDYLVQTTFPLLRSIARTLGVEISWVDLRWGVTEEQARSMVNR